MRKPTFRICKNKGADQLRSNCEADQRLCFPLTDSTIPLHCKPLAIFCASSARFVSEMFRKPHHWFSHDAAQVSICSSLASCCMDWGRDDKGIAGLNKQNFTSLVESRIFLSEP